MGFYLVHSFGTYTSVASYSPILFLFLFITEVGYVSLGEVALGRRHPMGPSSTFPSGHQSYMLLGGAPLCELCEPFCCGRADHCGCTGRQGWPLAHRAARPYPMQRLPAVGRQSCIPAWLAMQPEVSQG